MRLRPERARGNSVDGRALCLIAALLAAGAAGGTAAHATGASGEPPRESARPSAPFGDSAALSPQSTLTVAATATGTPTPTGTNTPSPTSTSTFGQNQGRAELVRPPEDALLPQPTGQEYWEFEWLRPNRGPCGYLGARLVLFGPGVTIPVDAQGTGFRFQAEREMPGGRWEWQVWARCANGPTDPSERRSFRVAPPGTMEMADLTITAARIEMCGFQGGCPPSLAPLITRFCVVNRGQAPAPAFWVRTSFAHSAEWRIAGLRPGAEICLAAPNDHRQVTVDTDQEVPESDESNNSAFIAVPTAPATCTPPPRSTPSAPVSCPLPTVETPPTRTPTPVATAAIGPDVRARLYLPWASGGSRPPDVSGPPRAGRGGPAVRLGGRRRAAPRLPRWSSAPAGSGAHPSRPRRRPELRTRSAGTRWDGVTSTTDEAAAR